MVNKSASGRGRRAGVSVKYEYLYDTKFAPPPLTQMKTANKPLVLDLNCSESIQELVSILMKGRSMCVVPCVKDKKPEGVEIVVTDDKRDFKFHAYLNVGDTMTKLQEFYQNKCEERNYVVDWSWTNVSKLNESGLYVVTGVVEVKLCAWTYASACVGIGDEIEGNERLHLLLKYKEGNDTTIMTFEQTFRQKKEDQVSDKSDVVTAISKFKTTRTPRKDVTSKSFLEEFGKYVGEVSRLDEIPLKVYLIDETKVRWVFKRKEENITVVEWNSFGKDARFSTQLIDKMRP